MTRPSDHLSDIEICSLDLLLRAKRKGAPRVNRRELLYTVGLPDVIRTQLVFTMLLMSNDDLVRLHGDNSFEITQAGEDAFARHLGKDKHQVEPTAIADLVIALPDRTRGQMQ